MFDHTGPDPQPRPRQEPCGRHGPGDEESLHRSYTGIKFNLFLLHPNTSTTMIVSVVFVLQLLS
jgi:hypothetical protein